MLKDKETHSIILGQDEFDFVQWLAQADQRSHSSIVRLSIQEKIKAVAAKQGMSVPDFLKMVKKDLATK